MYLHLYGINVNTVTSNRTGDGHLVVVMMTVVVMVVAVTMMPAVAEMFSRSARLRLWAHYQAGRKYQQQY